MLSDAGFSVLVLEANGYISGRSKTINHDTAPGLLTDLGSEWLYSVNSMQSFLAKNGLIGAADENLDTIGDNEETWLKYTQEFSQDGTSHTELAEDAYQL